MSLLTISRYLIIFGIILVVVGGLLYLLARMGFPLGNLPGDFRFENERFSCIIPLATSLLLSIVITVLLNLFIRLLKR